MRNKIVFWEFLLLFASVLVFRSIWMLLDRIPEMKNEFGLWALLILGMIVALIGILMINRYAVKRKTGRSPSYSRLPVLPRFKIILIFINELISVVILRLKANGVLRGKALYL